MDTNTRKIIKGSQIHNISPIVAFGKWNMYFRILVKEKGKLGFTECRIHQTELTDILNQCNFVIEQPKGNRKYPYLKGNLI